MDKLIKAIVGFLVILFCVAGFIMTFDGAGMLHAIFRGLSALLFGMCMFYFGVKIGIVLERRRSGDSLILKQYRQSYEDDYQQGYPQIDRRQLAVRGADSASMKNLVDMFKYMSQMQGVMQQYNQQPYQHPINPIGYMPQQQFMYQPHQQQVVNQPTQHNQGWKTI